MRYTIRDTKTEMYLHESRQGMTPDTTFALRMVRKDDAETLLRKEQMKGRLKDCKVVEV